MADALPSLGDEVKRKLHLTTEERALPPTRKEIVSAFEGILAQGGVQRVVVEIGKPIKVSRYVQESADPPPSMREEELFDNARNSTMEEFAPEKSMSSFHDYLFKAFYIITQQKLRPRAFLVSNLSLLRTRLGVDKLWNLGELFGVEVVKAEEIPPDVLLLTASQYGEEDVVLSIRMLLSIPPGEKS